jgi:hypothetical protein
MVALLSGLAACGEERKPEGTGNQKVLYVKYPGYLPVAGLWTRIEIPNRRVYLPEGERPNADLQVATWDFEGTTLELDSPPGFQFEVKQVTESDMSEEAQDFRARNEAAGGFIVRMHCNAVPNAAHELWVWVKHGDTVRYHDSFDMTCHRATRVEVSGLADGRYFVGGRTLVDVTLTSPSSLGSTRVWGEGLSLTDRKGIIEAEIFLANPHRQVLLLTMARPGTGPELAFQNLTYKPVLEAVEDPGWKLELGPAQLKPDGTSAPPWTLPVTARGTDGSELKGLYGCAWDITMRDNSTYQETGCQPTLRNGPPARACVKAHGRSVCRDYL